MRTCSRSGGLLSGPRRKVKVSLLTFSEPLAYSGFIIAENASRMLRQSHGSSHIGRTRATGRACDA